MSIFTQIVILLIILASMVMVLLAIRQLGRFESFDDNDDTRNLKEEVEDDRHIITRSNIFSTLVEAEPEKEFDKKSYKKNSKDPLSRRE